MDEPEAALNPAAAAQSRDRRTGPPDHGLRVPDADDRALTAVPGTRVEGGPAQRIRRDALPGVDHRDARGRGPRGPADGRGHPETACRRMVDWPAGC